MPQFLQTEKVKVEVTFLLGVAFDFFISRLQVQPVFQISRLSILKSDFWSLATFSELQSPPATNPWYVCDKYRQKKLLVEKLKHWWPSQARCLSFPRMTHLSAICLQNSTMTWLQIVVLHIYNRFLWCWNYDHSLKYDNYEFYNYYDSPEDYKMVMMIVMNMMIMMIVMWVHPEFW